MTYTKDPAAKLDWTFDWSKWLAAGETISASTMTVPTGITIATESHTDTAATVWLTGGAAGSNYKVTNHITTSQGREDDRSIRVDVRDR